LVQILRNLPLVIMDLSNAPEKCHPAPINAELVCLPKLDDSENRWLLCVTETWIWQFLEQKHSERMTWSIISENIKSINSLILFHLRILRKKCKQIPKIVWNKVEACASCDWLKKRWTLTTESCFSADHVISKLPC